jgi:hypothetical protein
VHGKWKIPEWPPETKNIRVILFQHLNVPAVEHHPFVDCFELAAVAAHVKTDVAGFDSMSALKKPETVAASVTHALEHCSLWPCLALTDVKLEQGA